MPRSRAKMDPKLIAIACPELRDGAPREKCARKTLARPAKRSRQFKEINNEDRGAGVNCDPPTKGQGTGLLPSAKGSSGPEKGCVKVKRIDAAKDAYKAFRPHLKKADDELLKLIANDVCSAFYNSDDDDDDDEPERVAFEISLRDTRRLDEWCELGSEKVQFVGMPDTFPNDIFMLVNGDRVARLPRVYSKVLLPILGERHATLRCKSFGCPGNVHVEVVGTKLAPVLPASVHEL